MTTKPTTDELIEKLNIRLQEIEIYKCEGSPSKEKVPFQRLVHHLRHLQQENERLQDVLQKLEERAVFVQCKNGIAIRDKELDTLIFEARKSLIPTQPKETE